MKKLTLAALVLSFFAITVSAHDVFPPEWRGLDGTTMQVWEFDCDQSPAFPNLIDNDYGTASACITVGEFGTGWLDNPGLGTQTGVWDIGGCDGQIVLDIDNRPLALDHKEINLQIAYYQAIGGAPTVEIPGAELVSCQTQLIEQDLMPGMGWYVFQSTWTISPNPDHEQIIITGDVNGSVIDQIVVDTYCIPEPVTVALLGLGLICLRKRS